MTIEDWVLLGVAVLAPTGYAGLCIYAVVSMRREQEKADREWQAFVQQFERECLERKWL